MRFMPLVIALLVYPFVVSAQSQFTRSNAPGPYTVGFRVVEQYDASREYRGTTDVDTGKPTQGERARPMQTLIWYPATQAPGVAMTAGDYLRLGGAADHFDQTAEERNRRVAAYVQGRLFSLSPQRAQAELAAPMTARRDAQVSTGKFPVVVYAPSFNAPSFENADLCEYLASLGYVVISSPSAGQVAGGMTTDLEGVEAQMADIQYLIGYAHTLPDADTDHLGVIGYSWGGLANVMAAAKDSRIRALVSLDGSVRSWPTIVEQSRFLKAERITVPFLFVASRPREQEDMAADMNEETSFLNKAKYADLYRVTLAPYIHANFSVMLGQRFVAEGAHGDYDAAELSVANAWVETYVRRFLDASLKGDVAARAMLDNSPAANGVPKHLLTVYKRASQGAPPTRAAFAAELARRGFAQAPTVYDDFRTRDPGFELSDTDLTAWGYNLLRASDAPSSVAIFRLNTKLHADSWNAWDSFGEAQAKNGDKASAIESYKKSLALNPGNRNAVEQIKVLHAKV